MSRQIVFIGFEVQDFPYRRRVTAIYELSQSDRLNFKRWSSIIRDREQNVEITSTDRLSAVLADERLRWSNPPYAAEGNDRILQG